MSIGRPPLRLSPGDSVPKPVDAADLVTMGARRRAATGGGRRGAVDGEWETADPDTEDVGVRRPRVRRCLPPATRGTDVEPATVQTTGDRSYVI